MAAFRCAIALAIAAAVPTIGVAQASADSRAGFEPASTARGTSSRSLIQAVGGRGATAQPARYDYLAKLDGRLQTLTATTLAGSTVSVQARRAGITTSAAGEVLVDVYVSGDVDAAVHSLRALGMRVTGVSTRAPQRAVGGFVPVAALPGAAALPATRAILPSMSAVDAGTVLSEGDAAMHGPQARAFGPNGTGVSVGVISDSINQQSPGIAGSVSSGNLPANTQALSEEPGGSDEGRAMAEIVYDEAPAISGIVFGSGTIGSAAKAAAIDGLVASGVKVISDDTVNFDQPFFQDGIVTQAVDRARAAGVAYLSSAGNRERRSWEGTYAPIADPSLASPTTEDFGGGDTLQTVGTLAPHERVSIVLNWAEPWGHATTDLAIDGYRANGTDLTSTGDDTDNLVTGIPSEAITFDGGTSGGGFGIAIRRVAGTSTPFMKDIVIGGSQIALGHPTNSGTINVDAAAARGALTVAAVGYATSTTPESFSSRGPITRYFDAGGSPLATPDVRQKPDLASTDGVSTTVAGLSPFFGTSAASPSAAGIAALIRSAKPLMPVDEVYAIMTAPANALDCPSGAGNPDSDCGVGFLLADNSVAMALDPTPPVVTPVVSPAAPDGANGWYRGAATVSWAVSDPQSPVVDPVGCAPTSIADGSIALGCSAISAGGTTAVPFTIKRDSTPPAPPVIAGITARTYLSTGLPKAAKITCSSSDTLSGVSGCAVTGLSAAAGKHVLTATATNGAGTTAVSTLAYTVTKPAAISKLKLKTRGLTLAKLVASGLQVTARVVGKSTRLKLTVTAVVPRPSGKGTLTIPLNAVSKRFKAGTARITVTPAPRAKRQLASVARAAITVTARGTASLTTPASLHLSFVVKR